MPFHPFFFLVNSAICQQNFIVRAANSPETLYASTLIINQSNSQLWSYVAIDRLNWIQAANSDSVPKNFILKGNSSTNWHSQWGHNDRKPAVHQFQFIVDLAQITRFKAFSLEPRTNDGDGSLNGQFETYEFYTAQDLDEINAKIENSLYTSKGNFDRSIDEKTLVILPFTIAARFVALRSLNHDTYASCAEFNLYADPNPNITTHNEITNGYLDFLKIDRTGWSITANSEHTTDLSNSEGPAANIIDDIPGTHWHTKYGNGGSGWHDERGDGPFGFKIDLGKETTFKAFSYMPRQHETSRNGNFRDYEFYAASTEAELNTMIENNNSLSKGNINHETTLSTLVTFYRPVTARYIALYSINFDRWAVCAEFNLYSDVEIKENDTVTLPIRIDENTDTVYSPFKIERKDWTITANSEQAITTTQNGEGPAFYIIDGNTTTIWHSKYSNAQNGHDDRLSSTDPFQFTINLHKETTFRAFSYMPRQSGAANGIVKIYEFYAAQTEEELNRMISIRAYNQTGVMNNINRLSYLVILPQPITAVYVAFRAIRHDTFGSCSEFNLYSDIPASFTESFTTSEFFSLSEAFSKSQSFTNSESFTKSKSFTTSEFFTLSERFSKSQSFTNSESFTKSKFFTLSEGFSKSQSFINSASFTKSKFFTLSEGFSKSQSFTNSESFSYSEDFTLSNQFSSYYFSLSSQFTYSKLFTLSASFSISHTFSFSDLFTPSSRPIGDDNSGSNKSKQLPMIIGIVIAVIAVLLILVVLFIFLVIRRKGKIDQEEELYEEPRGHFNSESFSKLFYFAPKDNENPPIEMNSEEVQDAFNFIMNQSEDPKSE